MPEAEEFKETKEVLSCAFALGQGLEVCMDGNVTFADVVKLLSGARLLPAAMNGAAKCLEEFKSADDGMKGKLKEWCVKELELQNDKAEAWIEGALALVIDLSDLLKLLPEKKNA